MILKDYSVFPQHSYNRGSRAAKAWADSDGGKVEIPSLDNIPNCNKPLKPFEAAATSTKIGELLSGEEGKENSASLDSYMMSQLNPLASQIIKKCLPNGLEVPFPQNVSPQSSQPRLILFNFDQHLFSPQVFGYRHRHFRSWSQQGQKDQQ